MRLLATAILAMLVGLAPAVAFAHAQLRGASPPVGGEVHGAPAQVELTFSEAIEPRFSSVRVEDAGGNQVDKNDLHVLPEDARHAAVSLGRLPPGQYQVVWRVVSVDTHRTQGRFGFTVSP